MFCIQDIKFPLQLDVYDLCTDELKERLQPIRGRMKEEDDRNVEKVSDVTAQKITSRLPP